MVEEWLGTLDLEGVDTVRAQLALTLAAEIDVPDAAAYAKARLTSELRSLLAELSKAALKNSGHRDVKRLLAEVM